MYIKGVLLLIYIKNKGEFLYTNWWGVNPVRNFHKKNVAANANKGGDGRGGVTAVAALAALAAVLGRVADDRQQLLAALWRVWIIRRVLVLARLTWRA